jgi:hypothetical protein
MVSSIRSKRLYAAPLLALVFVLAACGALISIPDATLITDGRLDGALPPPPSGDAATQADGAPQLDGAIPMCTADLNNDKNNCGACGHDCSNGSCNAGVCTLIASGGANDKLIAPYGLFVNRGTVYVAEGGKGAISSCTTTGCAVPIRLKTYANTAIEPIAITGNDAFLYWSNVYDGAGGPGLSIVRTPFDGGASTAITIPGVPKPATDIGGLSLGAKGLIVGYENSPPKFIEKPGDAPPSAAQLAFPSGQSSETVVAHGTGMYWTDGGAIYHCDSLPCSNRTLVRDGNGIVISLAVTDTYLYFLGSYEDILFQCKHDDLGNCVQIRTNVPPARALAANAGNIYVATWNPDAVAADAGTPTGSIMRCAEANCAGTWKAIATGFGTPQVMVIDGPSVYWTELEGRVGYLDTPGNVMKVPK